MDTITARVTFLFSSESILLDHSLKPGVSKIFSCSICTYAPYTDFVFCSLCLQKKLLHRTSVVFLHIGA